MKFHDELNPVLWSQEDLIPEVKEKLFEIANAFIEYIEIPQDAILDMVITGSSASYNYNDFSDLDLHIIVDYDKIHDDCPLVEGYLGALKNTFNKEHDITIHGVPVELYAEKKDQGTVHNGLYSLNTGWIDKPEKIKPTDNDAAVEAKFNEIKDMVDKCDDSEQAQELLEKIYTMRKAGLAEAGEFCTENLAFKKLRNEGCMDKLRQLKKEQIDKQLSLESYNESQYNPEEFEELKSKFNETIIPIWNEQWHDKFVLLLKNYGYKIEVNNKINEFVKNGIFIQTSIKNDIIPNMVKLYTDNGIIFNSMLDNRPTFIPNSVSILFGIYTISKNEDRYRSILNDITYTKELGSIGPIMSGKGSKYPNEARQVDMSINSMKYMSEKEIKTKFENGLQFMYEYLEECLQQIKEKSKNESIKEDKQPTKLEMIKALKDFGRFNSKTMEEVDKFYSDEEIEKMFKKEYNKQFGYLLKNKSLGEEMEERIYNVEFNYEDEKPGLAIGTVKVKATSEQEALDKAEQYAKQKHPTYTEDSCKLADSGYDNDEIIESAEDDKFNYMLLARLKQDCGYFLGNGNGYEPHLWAGNVEDQIAKMKELYNKVPEKPEWLSMEDIDNYEKEMLELKEQPIEEDLATLEVKIDQAQSNVQDIVNMIQGVKEDFDFDKAYNTIKLAEAEE